MFATVIPYQIIDLIWGIMAYFSLLFLFFSFLFFVFVMLRLIEHSTHSQSDHSPATFSQHPNSQIQCPDQYQCPKMYTSTNSYITFIYHKEVFAHMVYTLLCKSVARFPFLLSTKNIIKIPHIAAFIHGHYLAFFTHSITSKYGVKDNSIHTNTHGVN